MENKELINEIKKEITLLESWIDISITGGWSTHLNKPMQEKVKELKCLIYDINND